MSRSKSGCRIFRSRWAKNRRSRSSLDQMKGARLELLMGSEKVDGTIVSARLMPASGNDRWPGNGACC